MLVNGLTFKKLYPNKTFWKLTNKKELHNNYLYKTGINIDDKQFDPTKDCDNGLYFTEYDNIGMWLNYDVNNVMKWIRKVNILDDSQISIEVNKFKADKFVLEERSYIWSNTDLCTMAVIYDGMLLKYVKKRKKNICKLAVINNGLSLRYIKKQTSELCKSAINSHPCAFSFVFQRFKTEELWNFALECASVPKF